MVLRLLVVSLFGISLWAQLVTPPPGSGSGGSGTVTSVSGGGGTITVASPTTTPVITCATGTTSQLGCLQPDGSTITVSGGIISAAAASGVTTLTLANAASTGTTGHTLAKLTGAPSTAVIAATTDTGGVVGIVTAGAGTTGNATVQLDGSATCVFPGATTAGHYVGISSSTAGNCTDVGSTYPTSGQVIGRVLSTNGGGGTYAIDIFPAEMQAANAATAIAGTCVPTGGGTATLTFTLAGNSPWVCPLTLTANATSVTVTGGTFPTNGGGSLVFIVSSVTTIYTLATPSNFATGIPVSQTVSSVVTSAFSTTNSGTTWYPAAASNNLSYSQPTISSTPATPGASTYLNCWYTTAGYQCINSSGVQYGLMATTSPAFTGTPTAPTASQNNNSTQLATTAYTDLAVANAVAGVNPAVAVKYATVAAGDSSGLTYANGASGIGATMTGANNTVTTIDGHAFVVGDVGVTRLLIKNDTQSPSGAFNGIYLFTAVHTSITGDVFTRALDYDQPSDMNNTGAIPVQSGTANISTSWLMTAQIVTVGTTPLTFVQFSYNPATIPSATTATTQVPCDNSTKVATTAYTGFNCETVQTGTAYASSGYAEMIWNNGSGALAATLPATTTVTKCIGNYQAKSGAISFIPPSGSTIYYKGSAGTTSSATGLKSGGAAGDFICVVGQVDGVTWEAIGSGLGTWTNN